MTTPLLIVTGPTLMPLAPVAKVKEDAIALLFITIPLVACTCGASRVPNDGL